MRSASVECSRRVLTELQKWLPIAQPPDLTPFSRHLQDACVGCVGTLKETLTRALACVLEKGGVWKTAHLERALISENQLGRILTERTRDRASRKSLQLLVTLGGPAHHEPERAVVLTGNRSTLLRPMGAQCLD